MQFLARRHMRLKAGRWGRKCLGPRNLRGDKMSHRKLEGAGLASESQVGQKTRRETGCPGPGTGERRVGCCLHPRTLHPRTLRAGQPPCLCRAPQHPAGVGPPAAAGARGPGTKQVLGLCRGVSPPRGRPPWQGGGSWVRRAPLGLRLAGPSVPRPGSPALSGFARCGPAPGFAAGSAIVGARGLFGHSDGNAPGLENGDPVPGLRGGGGRHCRAGKRARSGAGLLSLLPQPPCSFWGGRAGERGW